MKKIESNQNNVLSIEELRRKFREFIDVCDKVDSVIDSKQKQIQIIVGGGNGYGN